MKLIIEKLEINWKNGKAPYIICFEKGINVVYSNGNQFGKSTIANSILLAFGSENSLMDIGINFVDLYVSFYNDNKWSEAKFTNKYSGPKVKYIDFLEQSFGYKVLIRNNNKYNSNKATILDFMNFFYNPQENLTIENVSNYKKSTAESTQDIKYNLIETKETAQIYIDLLVKQAQIIKLINDSKNALKINDFLSNDYKIDKKEEIEYTDLLNNYESLINSKKKMQKKLFDFNAMLKSFEENNKYKINMETTLKKHTIKINDVKVSIWDIVKNIDLFSKPLMSINEFNEIKNNKDKLIKDLNKIHDDIFKHEELIDIIPTKGKIYINREFIKEMLIETSNDKDIIKFESDKKEINDILEKEKITIENKLLSFESVISEELKKINIKSSKSGVGQQVRDLIKMIEYKKNIDFPIIFDAFLDGAIFKNKIKIFDYLKRNNIGQSIVFISKQEDEEDFIDFIKKENDGVNLIALEQEIKGK